MKRLAIPAAILAMCAVVAAGFSWDCLRVERRLRQRLETADEETRKHEQRLVQAVQALSDVPAAVAEAVAVHRSATERRARRAAYEQLKAATEKSLVATLDPTHPLARRVMDEVAGAINRRDVAENTYQEELREYQIWRSSWRGSVARIFTGDGQREASPSP